MGSQSLSIILLFDLLSILPAMAINDVSREEIVENVRKAMAPPIQYRQEMRRGDSIISALTVGRVVKGGVLTVRLSESQSAPAFALIVGQKSYMFFHDKKTALCLPPKQLSGQETLDSILNAPFVISDTNDNAVQIKTTGNLLVAHESACTVICTIARENWLPQRVTQISASGAVLAELTYATFQPIPEGDWSSFDVPNEYAIVETSEGSSGSEEIRKIAPPVAVAEADPPEPPEADAPTRKRTQLPSVPLLPVDRIATDEETGRIIIPAPPGMTQKEFDQRIRASVEEMKSSYRAKQEAGKQAITHRDENVTRLILGIASIAVLLGGGMFCVKRKPSSSAAAAK